MRNKFEIEINRQLKKSKIDFEYEAEKLPYTIHGKYLPDFVIATKTGLVYIETKGYFRPEHKRKMVAAKKCNPDADIRIIFYATPWTKTGRSYAKWAEKHGFKCAFRTIPQEWINEFSTGKMGSDGKGCTC